MAVSVVERSKKHGRGTTVLVMCCVAALLVSTGCMAFCLPGCGGGKNASSAMRRGLLASTLATALSTQVVHAEDIDTANQAVLENELGARFAMLQKQNPPRNEEELAADAKREADWLTETAKQPGVVALPSGLMYKVLEQAADNAPSPKGAQPCTVTYSGKLTSGKEFDAGTTTFAPNEVIKGWTEAMQKMKEGDRWELYVPSKLAYGDKGAGFGTIPGGATLVFDMKLNEVKK